jgi:hypothetical protein
MLRISQPRIISFVRLLGKLGIFRPLLEYCLLRWTDLPGRGAATEVRAESHVGNRNKNRYEIATGASGQDSLRRHEFLPLREAFSFHAQLSSEYFLRQW